MREFALLYSALNQTTSTNAKVEALVNYFSSGSNNDATWAAALLTGRKPPRPINTTDMRVWAAELAGIPLWLFEESYAAVGDLAETVSLLVSNTNHANAPALHKVMLEVLEIKNKTAEEKKTWLYMYWQSFSQNELFVFNKLITGSFRVGVSQQLVYRALAKVHQSSEKTIAHQLMGSWLPQSTSLTELLSNNSADDSKPYPFYLAYQLDMPLEQLGIPALWQIERKYDGIRGQIIVRNNQVFIWSRGEDLMNDKFTEFLHLGNKLPQGLVLDGEVLPVKDNRILSFAEMQKRIGRKNISKKILQEVPLCMMCYDLLEYAGEDIREKPLKKRRELLEQLIKEAQVPVLKISPLLDFDKWNQLDALRQESKSLGCEGLMLKHKESVYETGRRRGSWWKWKVEPYNVDAVLIYAQSGHGRRAGLFTDYTFAVWDNQELVPFAKAYSGLTDKEIIEVDAWIKRNTLEKFGPVRRVKPELVFELAFEGINLSPRHKSGIALRFPRILRWRRDKNKEEANTRADLLQLINAQ